MASETLLESPRPATSEHGAASRAAPAPVGLMLLISSLEHGGAERQVIELFKRLDRRRFRPVICSLSRDVPLSRRLNDPHRDLVIVPKRWKYDWSAIRRVARVMRARDIRVVHNFLFDAEMVGRCAAKLARVPVVIASERNTDYTRPWVQNVCLKLTREWFDDMIANSEAGKQFNIRTLQLPAERIHVVRNGVDVEYFKRTDALGLRRELDLPADGAVVGMIASFKRQKRHGDFFRTAREILRQAPDTWFVCVGEPLRDNQQGAETYHREMRALVQSLGVLPRFRFPGARHDMPAVYSLCDVTMLTSEREGTPNVLLESMACETPVVATDVSDNAHVVSHGEAGFIAPLGDVATLAMHAVDLLRDRDALRRTGAAARRWVIEQFSTAALARRTEAVYLDALRRKGVGKDDA
ncbi:MAG: glycosyltransferase [Phycisphaerae bacterium]